MSAGSPARRRLLVRIDITNLLASAPEESVNRGSSFVRIMNRVGSRPVHGSRYLRSIVIVSSPEIESSRSTAIRLSARVPRRASETTASGFPISGCRPKFWRQAASVGPATLCMPEQPRQNTRDRSLAGALRSDEQEHLLQVGRRSRARTRTTRRASAWTPRRPSQSSSRKLSQRVGRGASGSYANGRTCSRRTPACAVGASGSRTRGSRSRAGRTRPR